MKTYPIKIPRRSYRGSDPAKSRKIQNRNRVAASVEDYINADLANKPDDTIHQYISQSVALELGEDSKIVHEVIFSADCGHNGITIVKGDFERAMAAQSQPTKVKSEISCET